MPEQETSDDFAGVPDAFQRLWTPHRMVYIRGDGKPRHEGECPFCTSPRRDDEEGLVVHTADLEAGILAARTEAFFGLNLLQDRRPEIYGALLDQSHRYPQEALELYFAAVPEAPRDMEREAFARTLPQYASSQRFDRKGWEAFAAFAKQSGLIEREVSLDDLLQGE